MRMRWMTLLALALVACGNDPVRPQPQAAIRIEVRTPQVAPGEGANFAVVNDTTFPVYARLCAIALERLEGSGWRRVTEYVGACFAVVQPVAPGRAELVGAVIPSQASRGTYRARHQIVWGDEISRHVLELDSPPFEVR